MISLDWESEEHELFADVADHLVRDDLEQVEMDGLGQRPALPDDGDVPFFNGEGGGALHGNVAVPLLVPVVLGDVVEVVAPDDDGPLHFGGDDDSLEDLAADADVAGEGTLLVDVLGVDGFLWGLDAESDILEEPDSRSGLLGQEFLAVEEHVLLLLESSFMLSLGNWVLGYQPLVYLII